MLKKLVLAAAVCATVSFAAWDKFPVLENHKGETSVGATFNGGRDPLRLVPYVGSRYTILPNLELATMIPYAINLTENNDNGVGNPEFMARYQFISSMNVFLDVSVPTSWGTQFCSSAWEFFFGLQFSQKFGIVNFGSQLGATLFTPGRNKVTPPVLVSLGVEADFELGIPLVPIAGLNSSMEVGRYSKEGKDLSHSHTGHVTVGPYGGFRYDINQSINIKTLGGFVVGKHIEDDIPYWVTAEVNMGF